MSDETPSATDDTDGRPSPRGPARRPRRRARRRGRPRPRRRDDVHPLRRPRLPDVRRRGQGRAADAAARRAPRADRGVRGRGDRQADPGARASPSSPPGPGVTNGVSAIAQAQFAGSPDGRGRRSGPAEPLGQRQPAGARPAADRRLGRQAGPHPAHRRRRRSPGMDEAFTVAALLAPRPGVRRRADGRVLQLRVRARAAGPGAAQRLEPDADDGRRGRRAARARRAGRCWSSAPTCGPTAPRRPRCASSRALGIPTITNGMGRGVVPGGHPLLVTKARGAALGGADLVVVVGTPLDFRLGYGVFGGKDGATPAARRARRRLPRPGLRRTPRSPRSVVRRPDARSSTGSSAASTSCARRPTGPPGSAELAGRRRGGRRARPRAAQRRGRPDPPGPHLRRAGAPPGRRLGGDRRRRRLRQLRRQVRRAEAPRRLARPGPLRLPGRRPRARPSPPGWRRPSAQVMLLLGDGAAGFSLMDVDTLVRHDLPVVMVMGNNSAWGLEKGPMQMLYGYDVVADLAQRTPLRRGRHGARRRRRDRHRPAADRPRARPRLRRGRALPRQRHHRRRGGVPAQHVRHLMPPRHRAPARPARGATPRSARSPSRPTRRSRCGPDDPYVARLRDTAARDRDAELWVAVRATTATLLGCVTFCPPGSPWRELAREDEGEFRMLAVAPGRAGPRGRRRAGRHCATSAPAARRSARW